MPTSPVKKSAAKKKAAPKKKTAQRTPTELASLVATKLATAPQRGEELAPTRAEDWASASPAVATEEGFIVELPSGNRVRARRTLNLPMLVQDGTIPNPLNKIIAEAMERGEPNFLTQNADPQANRQMLQLLEDQCVEIVLEPKVSRPTPQGRDPKAGPEETWSAYIKRIHDWKPDPGTISLFAIDMSDKMYLMAIGQGMAADLETFRAQSQASLDGLQAGKDVARPTKRTGGTGGGNRAARRSKTRA